MKRNSFRIVGGRWRSRRLSFPDGQSLRPTLDRVRETVFNWLAADIPGAMVLDAFAGSGALGIESLSRGARAAVFIDTNRTACESIHSNIQLLSSDGHECEFSVECCGVNDYLARKAGGIKFDIVFLDPPFGKGLLDSTLSILASSKVLGNASLVYTEMEQHAKLPDLKQLSIYKDKMFGGVRASVWKWNSEYSM